MTRKFLTLPPLELWGGIECTVNRVGDTFFDQIERSGHASRLDDLDLFAQLGIKALRYPILWERTAPNGLEQADWSWADERLNRLRELGIKPIIGLVHHGSGPRSTSLVDPAFAGNLARFARAVAQRYPWVEHYTPVNEPLTTARFSGLYGHWYPHGRDDLIFASAFLNQCRAVVLAMDAIRQVNPAARLVQTEDLGKTFSTLALTDQANFENERRWLTFDLLCGRLDREYPLWGYLHLVGIKAADLDWFREHPCPPDIIGINSYLTSERFLDERLERYPARSHGSNGMQTYADVEAVRVRAVELGGLRALLAEAWQRYRLPLAITEVHNGGAREEQLRWFMEVWKAARSLRRAGTDIRAVTAWSLLGAYDWNNLVTHCQNHYESGVFDLRGPRPRPTALTTLLRRLAAGRKPTHPVLATPGWWRRPERLLYQPVDMKGVDLPAQADQEPELSQASLKQARPILIAGAAGTLGSAFMRLCALRRLSHYGLTRWELDIAEPASIDAALDQFQPWAVVNAAGYVNVDKAEYEPDRCYRENTDGPALLAAACARRGIQLLTFSSALVFDGNQQVPYIESDPIAPLNVYGCSQARAEQRVLAALPTALVVRTGALFGPWDEQNFVIRVLRTLASGVPFAVADDALISLTYIPDLVHTCLDLLIDGERGLLHLANPSALTWMQLARNVADLACYTASRVEGCPTQALGLKAQWPGYSVLGSQRTSLLLSLNNALDRYLQECEVPWTESLKDGLADMEQPFIHFKRPLNYHPQKDNNRKASNGDQTGRQIQVAQMHYF